MRRTLFVSLICAASLLLGASTATAQPHCQEETMSYEGWSALLQRPVGRLDAAAAARLPRWLDVSCGEKRSEATVLFRPEGRVR